MKSKSFLMATSSKPLCHLNMTRESAGLEKVPMGVVLEAHLSSSDLGQISSVSNHVVWGKDHQGE